MRSRYGELVLRRAESALCHQMNDSKMAQIVTRVHDPCGRESRDPLALDHLAECEGGRNPECLDDGDKTAHDADNCGNGHGVNCLRGRHP